MMLRPRGIQVILITGAIVFFEINALDGHTQRREAKRSDGLVRGVEHQTFAEQIERIKILKEFREMQNQLEDLKRELKKRKTLLPDTNYLQKKLQKEVKDIKKDLKEELLDDLTKTMKGFNKTLKSIRSVTSKLQKETKTAVVTLQKEIKDAKQRITKVKTKGSRETEKLKYQLLALKNKTDHRHKTIAFSARLPSSITRGTSSGLVFSKVITNIGGGFNSTDGVFYCPKKGVYMFNVNVDGYRLPAAHANIMKNNVAVSSSINKIYSNKYPFTSLSLVLRLRSGDRIWVNRAGHRYSVHSYFTGILINPF